MNSKEKLELINEVREVAFGAGKVLKKFENKVQKLKIHPKKSQGIASEADLASEKYILNKLKKIDSTFSFIAEEQSFLIGQKLEAHNNHFTWAIDPLDGTNNFLNGINYYAISIGLLLYGQPFLGLVYRPSTGEIFWGAQNQGSYYQGMGKNRPIKIKPFDNSKSLKEAIFATGFSSEKGTLIPKEFESFQKIYRQSRAIRRMGSAALDLCYVGTGVFDGFWERGLAVWDVAAGSIICQEAGVNVSGFKGELFNPFSENILAARNPLWNKVKKLLAD